MELEGVVLNGAFVPDDAAALPEEGTRVRARIEPVPAEEPKAEEPPAGKPLTFGEVFARFKGVLHDLPADMASQHEHYRLGTPKR
ncbi:MAG: hypothetical protein K2X87_23420 [Gemmataceae bacterium]|nr:hypothetical protein [Gemmataceae bacterium]